VYCQMSACVVEFSLFSNKMCIGWVAVNEAAQFVCIAILWCGNQSAYIQITSCSHLQLGQIVRPVVGRNKVVETSMSCDY